MTLNSYHIFLLQIYLNLVECLVPNCDIFKLTKPLFIINVALIVYELSCNVLWDTASRGGGEDGRLQSPVERLGSVRKYF